MRAVPGLVEVKLPVELFLADEGQQGHPPTQQRPAVGIDDRQRQKKLLVRARRGVKGQADLADVVGAGGAAGRLPRGLHRREEEADEYRRREEHHSAEDDPGKRPRPAGVSHRRAGALACLDLAQPHHAADQPGDPGQAEEWTREHAEHDARQRQPTRLLLDASAGRGIEARFTGATGRGRKRRGHVGWHGSLVVFVEKVFVVAYDDSPRLTQGR